MSTEDLRAQMGRLRARAERAEEALRRVHEKQEAAPWFDPQTVTGAAVSCPYHHLIDSLDAVVMFVDGDGHIQHVNAYAADLFDLDRGSAVGSPVRDLLDRVIPPGTDHDARVRRLLRGTEASELREIEIVLPDGSEACLSQAGRPVYDDEGELLGVVVVGTDVTARRNTERELATHQEMLRSLASELALAEQRERRRIAVRIHEDISQNLAYAKLRVEALNGCAEGNTCESAISEIRRMLDEAIAGTRALAFELSPPLLHELGFSEAVEWLTEQFDRRHDARCAFHGNGARLSLPEDVSVTLFRAVRELLDNAVEHAGAQQVTVSVARNDGHIEVQVADDGHGFNAPEALAKHDPRDGFGLFNVRERLDYIGGEMQIVSDRLTGTRVTLTAPVRN